MKFYVYEWFIVETGEIFHVGKGCGNRMFSLNRRNEYFLRIYSKYNCDVRIYKDNLSEEDAFKLEKDRICELKQINQAKTNLHESGCGGNTFKYLDKERLDIIKDKISKNSISKWKNPEMREFICNKIRIAMSKKSISDKISERTKIAMKNPKIKNKHRDKISSYITLIYSDNTVMSFETITDFIQYIKCTYNLGRSYCYRNLLKNKPICKSNKLDKISSNYMDLIDYKIIQTKRVTTIPDECKEVG